MQGNTAIHALNMQANEIIPGDIYIYIYIERERDRVYIYIYIYIYNSVIYIYIYIYRVLNLQNAGIIAGNTFCS